MVEAKSNFPLGVDLLGEPINRRRGFNGRPRHHPTNEMRAKAAEMHEAGAGQPEIAKALGITLPTLRLHYHREIGSGSKTWLRHAEPEAAPSATCKRCGAPCRATETLCAEHSAAALANAHAKARIMRKRLHHHRQRMDCGK